MGGVVEGGVGIADKTSPRRAAIEKAQADLRIKYEVRDKRKKELEFLLEGGDPLELECVNVASVSVQSTSVIDRHPNQFVTSEAKGSFTFTASPHGDSVESSGRLGTNPSEPNSADNLLLFDAERDLSDGNKSSLHPSRSNIVSLEDLSRKDSNHRTGEHDSTALAFPKKSYKRRYRSHPNRDETRSRSTNVNQTRGSHDSSLPSHHVPNGVKGPTSDVENRLTSSNSNSKPTSPVDDALQKTVLMNSQQDIELDVVKAVESTKDLSEGFPVTAVSDAIACETSVDDQRDHHLPLGVVKTPIQMDSDGPEAIQAMEGVTSAEIGSHPDVTAIKVDNKSSSYQINGFSSKNGDKMKNDAHNNCASCGRKGWDCESSCTQTRRNINGNHDTEMCTKLRGSGSNGHIKDHTSTPDEVTILEGDESVKEKKDTGGRDSSTLLNVKHFYTSQIQRDNGVQLLPEEELKRTESALEDKLKDQIVIEETEACRLTESESGRISDLSGDKDCPNNKISCTIRDQESIDFSIPDVLGGGSLTRASDVSTKAQLSAGSDLRLTKKIDEDLILKEAQIIEVKRKRMADISSRTSPKQIHRKSHWDYVLEEMAWLANDFAQERVWKIAVAAQISSRAAFTCCLKKQEKNFHREAKKVAHTLAKSVMEFWQSVEETSNVLGPRSPRDDEHSVQAYAVRFRKFNNYSIVYNQAEMPLTPARVSDMRIVDAWKDNLREENLFYTVLPGTIENYRSSVESHVGQLQSLKSEIIHLPAQKILTVVLEEGETSAEFESQDNPYQEQERETNTYGMSMAFKDSKLSRFGRKKQKHSIHAYGVRSYEVSSENNVVHQSALLAKRPGSNLDVSIPTKRVRTASRRVVSPFSAGTSGFLQGPHKTDVSSGDTNSFQDDQSTLRGGSHAPYSLEVESAGKFEKQIPFESAEVSTRHKKKKKKAKRLNTGCERRWQVDSAFQNDQFQRDLLRKSHQLESNCSSGLLGQPMSKKLKTMRQSQDISFENITPIGGSFPSPAASQMSNMSNPNKFIKMLGGRDQGRKSKALKMPAGQLGSGIAWTLFEDQALVVLAHDLGPNWELISDAINSALQFKCIFRKAKECKERHNCLMDRTSGDGADSAEDSCSSQPYPSTLPGIPKGSARQLFQRLQGPMEEDTLKSHFEKIIIIGQKQHYRTSQEPKQLQQPHSSHAIALSQVSPNNLNGGPILTPLDLCEATVAGTEVLPLGYQFPHCGGLAIPNQGTVTPMHPTSGGSCALQGSPSMIAGSNFPSSPSSLNSSVRDARYGLPRSASLSSEDPQRIQPYNQIISGRSVPQSNMSSPGSLPGPDRGVRMLPGGNGMGLVSGGVNRGMPMARPVLQGITSPSIVNSGSMVSPSMPPGNMHSGVGPGQGSSILRPREALHMIRPGMGQDLPRPMMPDLQVQDSPGNSQVAHFGEQSSPSPSVPSYALHHQPSHPISSPQQPPHLSSPHHPHFPSPTTANHAPRPQQQSYTMRLAKDRQHQQQQRFLQHQQQITAPSPLAPHIQTQQPQLPTSSSLPNNSQVQAQMGSSRAAVSLSPLASVSSTKQQAPTRGAMRNAPAGGNNKQRQRQNQQLSQASRQHPQQMQQQPPGKVAKGGVGRGKPINQSLVNGASLNTAQFGPSQLSNQSVLPQKRNLGPSTKRVHQMDTSHSDNNSLQGQPTVSSLAMTTDLNQVKLVNQNHLGLQRIAQPNPHVNLEPPNKLQTRDPCSDHDHRTSSSSTEIDTVVATLPQVTSSATTNIARVGSEPLLDPNALNLVTDMSSLVSMSSNTSEPSSLASNSSQSQQLQFSSLHSQQLHQAGNGNLSGTLGDSRLE